MQATERFLRVLRQQPVDRVPVVGVTSVVTVELMRAVGSRWPEAHHDPAQMVRAGAAAHELLGLESVKVPFDMTVEAGAFGAEIDYGSETALPKVLAPRYEEPGALIVGEEILARGRYPVVLEAIRMARARYGGRVPVIASALGPLTLAAVLFGIENVLCWMMDEPERLHAAMEAVTRLVGRYVRAQREAGADVVQIGDPTASGDVISPAQYLQFAAPYHRRLAQAADFPFMTHICGDLTRHLPHLAAVGFAGISFDVKTDIRAARTHLKGRAALVGYLSTTLLQGGTPEQVRAAAADCLREGVDALNAGCAVAPDTPLANLRAMIAAVAGR